MRYKVIQMTYYDYEMMMINDVIRTNQYKQICESKCVCLW